MAANSVSPGVSPANAPSRRMLLGALAAVPMLATSAPAAATVPAIDRTAWDSTFARMTAANAETKRLSAIQNKAAANAEATAPDASLVDVSAFVGLYPFRMETFDVDAYQTRQRATIGETWFPNAKEQALEFASYDSVRAYQRAHEANLDRYDVRRLWDEVEAVSDVEADAITDLLLMPAPDLAAVHWKLAYLFDQGSIESTPSWRRDMVEPVLADVARFAGVEGR